MNVRIGDIVRFISEKLEGKVTGIIDHNTVNVYCEEYGFEIPGAISDLVVIQSDFSRSSSEKEQLPKQSQVTIDSADTLYLAIVPENFQNLPESRFELYLVNDTAQTTLYSIGSFNGEKHTGITAGNCSPDSTALIGTYNLKEVEALKMLNIQAIFYSKGTYIPKNAIDTQIKLNPVSLCKSGVYKHVRWFNPVTCIRPLDKENLVKTEEIDLQELQQAAKEKKDEAPVIQKPAQEANNNTVEVDLHIDQLIDSTAGMENKDILDYQLDVFHKTLDKYKLRRGQKIVFIHGKGDGILRQRILWELQTHYKRFRHQDASFKQYGYGATMVTIK